MARAVAAAAVRIAGVRIAGDRLARVSHGPFGSIPGVGRCGGERDRQPGQRAGPQRVVGGVQRRGRFAEQRGSGVRGGVEVEVLGVQQRRGGQQPRLVRVPGEPDGFVDDPDRAGVGAGLGQRLGQAEQQLAPAGRGGLRRPPLHVQGVPEMTGGFLVGQRVQRLLAGQPGVVHGPAASPTWAAVPGRINCADRAEDNVGPIATLLYGFSLLYCMTTSLAHGGAGLGTLGLPAARLRELAARAGFARVRHVEMDNPFNSLYELAR